jgi:hypothetical protein
MRAVAARLGKLCRLANEIGPDYRGGQLAGFMVVASIGKVPQFELPFLTLSKSIC